VVKRLLSVVMALVLTFAVAGSALASTPGELLIWADDTRAPVMEELGKQFEAEFGIPVKVMEMGLADIRSQLAVAGPAGEGPDIIVGPHDWLGEFIVNGLLEPIDLGPLAADFEPVTIEAFTWGDTLYGVPAAFEAIGLIYNKALVPEPPKTWDELLEIAYALTDREKGYYGFLMQMPDPYHTFPLMSANGGYVFGTNEDGTLNPLDVGLNNEGAVKGLEVFDHLLESGLVPVGTDYNTMTSLFNQGRVGMMISGPWALGDAQKAGIDFGYARIPTIDGGQPKPFVGVQGFMVSAFSQNKLLADVFLKEFVIRTDTYLSMFARDPRPPAYLPALEQLQDNLIIQGVRASGSVGIPMPAIPEMASVWTAWSDAIELVMNQELEPKEALDIAVQQILELIRSSR